MNGNQNSSSLDKFKSSIKQQEDRLGDSRLKEFSRITSIERQEEKSKYLNSNHNKFYLNDYNDKTQLIISNPESTFNNKSTLAVSG